MSLRAALLVARLGVALALAVTARPAAARPTGAEADAYAAALTRAIAAKERALDVNEPPRWEETLRLFQEAAGLRFTRECAYEIGVAAEHLSRHDLAVEGYEAALDLGVVGPPRARAQAFVAAHASRMARLAVRGPAGRIVQVAGVHRGRLPLRRPLVLFPGEVRLDILDPPSGATPLTVRLQAGQLEVLDLDKPTPVPQPRSPEVVVPAPAPAPAPATTEPAPPPAPPELAAGVPPAPPPPSPLDAKPAAADVDVPSRGIWLAVAGAVVTVAAVALLPISGNQIDSDRSALAAECVDRVVNDACTAKPGHGQAAQDLVDSIATWKGIRTGATVGIGVGLVAVGAGLILRYRDGANAAAAAPTLVFVQESGGLRLGVAWTGRF